MSAFEFVMGGWLLVNAAVFAALMLRRPHPVLRERLFRWVIAGHRRRERIYRPSSASESQGRPL
jgi:hypothetical protein